MPDSNLIILRHPHLLLKLLPLHVIVNQMAIYELQEKKPLQIPCDQTELTLSVTNGFQHSRTIKIRPQQGVYFYEVESRIDNIQLIIGVVLLMLLFAIYIATGLRLFMLLANLPILILLWLFYFKRDGFILIHRLRIEKPMH
ncbi:MAG: hypothetical protein WCJ85_11255 [Chitinophagaceae bacterium]